MCYWYKVKIELAVNRIAGLNLSFLNTQLIQVPALLKVPVQMYVILDWIIHGADNVGGCVALLFMVGAFPLLPSQLACSPVGVSPPWDQVSF